MIKELQVAEELTRDNDVLTLTMCVNYGGRAELADAARSIAREVAAGRLNPEQGRREDLRPPPLRPRARRRRPGLAHVGGAAAVATSCSGRRRTPSWSSPTCCGPTSTGATCGPRSRSTPARPRYGGALPAPTRAERHRAAGAHRRMPIERHSALVEPACPRSAAARAGPEDLQGVADVGEAVLAGDRRRSSARRSGPRPRRCAPQARQTRWWWWVSEQRR